MSQPERKRVPTGSAEPPPARQPAILDEIDALIREYVELEPEPGGIDCPLAEPLFGAEEICAAVEALLSQQVTLGSRVRAFESAFAELVGSRHALMVNSGSSANLLALFALSARTTPSRLRPGDEVIVPAVTWATTVAPIVQAGAVPVFVDVDPRTLNLRCEKLEEAWSPRTRAVMPVHVLGNPVAMPELMDFARQRSLWVIEDACEALGSMINGRWVGTLGDLGTYSFYFSHHITTIEGGMLVTDEDKLADTARSLRTHGWTRDMDDRRELEAANPTIDPRFLFFHLGFNLRPTEMQGAIGLVQLPRLKQFNEARRRYAHRLLSELRDLSGELDFVIEQEGGYSTWFGFAVLARDAQTRQRLLRHLEQRRVATRPVLAGNIARHPAFLHSPHRCVGELPGATAIAERGLYIGNHPGLGDRRMAHIVEAFRSFFEA